MGLHPQAAALLSALSGGPPIHSLPLPVARKAFEETFLRLAPGARDTSGVDREDLSVPRHDRQIPVRLYRPASPGPHPALVYYHGGGFVLGTLDMYDGICATLAREASCIVLSVDYGLAPEHPFPEPVQDAYIAAEWIREHAAALGADAAKIAVGGDSAGGNLAAVVSLINRDRGNPPFVGQLLIYPATELTGQPFPSKREFLQGYFLERDLLVWFQRNYLPNREDAGNPWASPLLASDLSGLPPAMIITAEYDPLRDEGEAYGSRLRESGVPVITKRYDGMIHGFVSMLGLFPEAEQALQEAAAWLRNLYQTGVV